MIQKRELHESKIVWLADLAQYPYVREDLRLCGFRHGRPPRYACPGQLIGYAELQPDAPSECGSGFLRRVFYVQPHDRAADHTGLYMNSGCPTEGVNPLTVQPNVYGVQDDRAWGGPLLDAETRKDASQ